MIDTPCLSADSVYISIMSPLISTTLLCFILFFVLFLVRFCFDLVACLICVSGYRNSAFLAFIDLKRN